MNSTIVLFVATSLILIVAMVAIAIPNPVQAAPKHQWCYTSATVNCGPNGFDSKGACKKADAEDLSPTREPCHKVPLP